MKKAIRLISLLLCMVMLALLFVSCKKDETESSDTVAETQMTVVSTQDSEETTWETDENGFVKDRIGEVDLGGREIQILAWEEGERYQLPQEASEKDVIQNEVYLRNLDLQERLNIVLKPTFQMGKWQNNAADRELLNTALAGQGGYDLITSYSLWPPVMAINGVLLNLHNYNFPDFEMPWWPQTMVDNWTQYGSLFYVADNCSVHVLHSINVMYVNLSMLENYGVKDLLQTVIDGKWTVDKLYEYTGFFHGDSLFEETDENFKWGLVVDDHSRMDAFYYSAGFSSCRNDANGKATLAFTSQSDLDAITKFVDKMIAVMERPEADIAPDKRDAMYNKKTAFMLCSLGSIISMEADHSYAAIPVPKLDLDQTEYQSINNNAYDVWCVPITAKDPETSALIIEAFASSDYRTLAPFFYDKYLKGRYSVSWQGAEIYDIIRSSVKVDFGRTGAGTGVTDKEAVQFFRPCFYSYSAKEVACENVFATELAKANSNKQIEVALRGALDKYRQLANVK